MSHIQWHHGQRWLGCTYHRVAWMEEPAQKVQIDVFVRPADVTTRGVAVTVKRFRAPDTRLQCDIPNAAARQTGGGKLHRALTRLGASTATATVAAESFVALLAREEAIVEAALVEARRLADLRASEELPPPNELWSDLE